MTKAIAYHYNKSLNMYQITCEEGTSWMIDADYLSANRFPVYSPYTGFRVSMIEQLGAMVSVLPWHQ